MMKTLVGLTLMLLVGLCSLSFADELLLKNGDVLSGEIISLDASMVVMETTALGRLRIERSQVQKGVFYGTRPPVSVMPFDAPTDAVILTDWKDQLRKNECRNFVTFTNLKIVEKRFMGDRIEVRLQVRGDWFGGNAEFLGGPCAGFLVSRGKGQIVDKSMVYKKWTDHWSLDSLR